MTRGTGHPRSRSRSCAGRTVAVCLALAAINGLTGCGDGSQAEQTPRTERADTAGSTITHFLNDDDDATEAARRRIIPAAEPAPKPTERMEADASCITAGCHVDYLTTRYTHGPVSQMACDTCHGPETEVHTFPMKRAGNATCTFCHAVTGTRAHEHDAGTAHGGTSCHDAHASDTKYLLRADSIEASCRTCHTVPLKRFAHEPFADGQCTLCHHPHQSDEQKLLRTAGGNDHCYACHESMRLRIANAPFVHEPAQDNCVTCHDPHTSDHPAELHDATHEHCLSCHTDMAQTVDRAAVSHDALFTGRSCANCHDPHAAGRTALLSDRVDHLCMQCHDEPVTTRDGRTLASMTATLERKHLHGPVRSGDCDACHSAHGSSNARLLRKSFPEAFYAEFDLANYALCFECHNADLVLAERTASLTEFRDGDRNLHYVHVHRDRKGRTCRTCHLMHGSDLPQHMASEVPFEDSQWAMPIGFERHENGGSCAPGCHEPMQYERGGVMPDADREGGAP